MNLMQRGVIFLGTVLVCLSGLYPPYNSVYNHDLRQEQWVGLTKPAGRFFILSPPTLRNTKAAQKAEENYPKTIPFLIRTGNGEYLDFRLNSTSLLVEWGTTILTTIGLAVVLKDRNPRQKKPIIKTESTEGVEGAMSADGSNRIESQK